jgi:hypothetical protein
MKRSILSPIPAKAALGPALLFMVSIALAGPARAGSEFSIGGLGTWVWPSDARGKGMGGVSIAVQDKRNLSLVNPAAAAYVEEPTLTLSMTAETRHTDDGTSTFKKRTADFPLLRGVIFPPGGFRLSAALHQWNHTSFDLEEGRPDSVYGSQMKVEGSGGFTALWLGGAMRPAPWLALGVAADFPFGSYRETWTRDYPESLFVDTSDRVKGSPGSTPSWTFGAIVSLGRSSLGGYIRPGRDLSITDEVTSTSGHTTRSKRTLGLPLEAGGGAAVEILSGLRAGFDYAFSDWSSFTVDGASPPGFRDVTRIGVGLEWVRDPRPRARWIRRVPLRIGYDRQPMPFRDSEGNDIDERFVTLGAGLPFSKDNGMVDAAVEIGRRGDLSRNDLRESLVRVTVAVTFSSVNNRLFPQ